MPCTYVYIQLSAEDIPTMLKLKGAMPFRPDTLLLFETPVYASSSLSLSTAIRGWFSMPCTMISRLSERHCQVLK